MPLENDDKDLNKADETQNLVEEGQQAEDAAALEAEAKLMGWVPKDDFHGKDDEWADAATFVKRGKEINPILRKNNQRLMKELEKRDREIAELKLTQQEFSEMYAKMSENAYKRAIDEAKQQRKVARREGNDDDVETLTDQIDELERQAKDVTIPGKNVGTSDKEAAQQARTAVFEEWAGENPWYDVKKNPGLYYAVEGLAMEFAKTSEGKALAGKKEFLDRVKEMAKETMPEAFKNPRRANGSPVGTSDRSRSDGTASGKKSYNDLPPEAKAACDRQVKTIKGFTKDKYVQYYFEQEGVS